MDLETNNLDSSDIDLIVSSGNRNETIYPVINPTNTATVASIPDEAYSPSYWDEANKFPQSDRESCPCSTVQDNVRTDPPRPPIQEPVSNDWDSVNIIVVSGNGNETVYYSVPQEQMLTNYATIPQLDPETSFILPLPTNDPTNASSVAPTPDDAYALGSQDEASECPQSGQLLSPIQVNLLTDVAQYTLQSETQEFSIEECDEYRGDIDFPDAAEDSHCHWDRNDIVVAKQPNQAEALICKRITALEGDRIHNTMSRCNYKTVPKGHVWLEGDNRKSSYDSKDFGPLPYALIHSRVFFRVQLFLSYRRKKLRGAWGRG